MAGTISVDFAIDYDMKRVYHNSGTQVYTANALYSWLMDTFDEQGAMDDEVPMSAQTPTEYSFINGWFIDDLSMRFVKTGAIKSDGFVGAVEYMQFAASNYIEAGTADIGLHVLSGGSTFGVLLDYNNTEREWWVRESSTFAPSNTLTLDGGTGAGTLDANGGTFGEKLWANIYTLGSIETGTDIFIYQAGSKITSYWPSGHVDLLVKVKEAGAEIDGADITVFARVWTDLYDHFPIDLSSGGRNAVPLATSNDLDNPTAIGTVLNNLDTVRIMFVNGTIGFETSVGEDPVIHMVLHGETSHATAFILNAPTTDPGTFTLGNIEGTFADTENLELCREIKFDGQLALFTDGSTVSTDSGTAVIRKITQDPEGVGTKGVIFVTGVTGTFDDNDELLVGGSTFAIVSGTIITSNTFDAAAKGANGFEDTIEKDLNNGATIVPTWNVIVDLNGLHVDDLYEVLKAYCRRTSTIQTYPTNGTSTIYSYNGERYIVADTSYTQMKKGSPFATFAGGKLFGARGVWIQDMHSDDIMNYSLIDALNTTQDPPIQANFVISSLQSGDRVLVAKTTGDNYTIDKDQFSVVAGTIGLAYVDVTEDLATLWKDLPSGTPAGVLRVRYNIGDPDEGEDIYAYSAVDKTAKRFSISPVTARIYDGTEKAYVPYVDQAAGGTGIITVTVIYQADRYVMLRVRKKGIIPFQTKGEFKTTGYTQGAIRTADSIVALP